MEEERRVDLVRVPREEQVFEREDIFGRDASSVFPTEFKKHQQEDLEAMKEAIGAKKFISETELLKMKTTQGGLQEGGDAGPIRPLAEILKERKEAKDAEFQERWKLMKQGKNRPLDKEDIEFLDANLKADLEKLRQQQQEEQMELQGFREAVEAARQADPEGPSSSGEQACSAALKSKPPPVTQIVAAKKPALNPMLRAVVKAKAKIPPGSDLEPEAKIARIVAPDTIPEQTLPDKTAKLEKDGEGGEESSGSPAGLQSLLGGYGSDDDDD